VIQTRILIAAAIAAVSVVNFAQNASAAEAGAGDSWAARHPRRAEVNARLRNQNRRIYQERKEGEPTRAQARTLHREDRQIRQEERAMASQNGGAITKSEQAVLNQQENKVSQQIGKYAGRRARSGPQRKGARCAPFFPIVALRRPRNASRAAGPSVGSGCKPKDLQAGTGRARTGQRLEAAALADGLNLGEDLGGGPAQAQSHCQGSQALEKLLMLVDLVALPFFKEGVHPTSHIRPASPGMLVTSN